MNATAALFFATAALLSAASFVVPPMAVAAVCFAVLGMCQGNE